jgi:hypothetical protein
MNIFTAIAFSFGTVLVTIGAGMIYRPLGVLAAGAVFLGLAFASARRAKKST